MGQISAICGESPHNKAPPLKKRRGHCSCFIA
jgi:hypothetical protein